MTEPIKAASRSELAPGAKKLEDAPVAADVAATTAAAPAAVAPASVATSAATAPTSVETLTQGVGKLGIDGTVTQDGPGIRNPDEAKAIQEAKAVAAQEQAKTAQLADTKNGEVDPGFAAALERQRQRQLEADQLVCSLQNKDACLMCSG